MALRARRGELERELQDAVDAFAREHRFLEHDLALGALEQAPADRRILAFGVLAHDDEVDVARLAIGERRRDAWHQPAWTHVDVLVEAAAELDQRSPERHVIRNGGGPADRAIENRLERRKRLEPVLRHHPAGARVMLAAPIEVREFEVDAEPRRGDLEHAQPFGNDFAADAVTWNDGDSMLAHPAIIRARPFESLHAVDGCLVWAHPFA